MQNYRRSKQRERILEILKNTTIHPTAGWIYNKLSQEFAGLSMGTVYRNLNILIEQGLVVKIDFGSTFDRFEANTTPHYHFICEKCGSIRDIDMPVDTSHNEKAEKLTPFKITQHRIKFYGLCNKCME